MAQCTQHSNVMYALLITSYNDTTIHLYMIIPSKYLLVYKKKKKKKTLVKCVHVSQT